MVGEEKHDGINWTQGYMLELLEALLPIMYMLEEGSLEKKYISMWEMGYRASERSWGYAKDTLIFLHDKNNISQSSVLTLK